ncbi:TPA: hypothetical protein PTV74_003582 [Clostridium botulinum]|uniref:hypothetical protein n=1 Tax=Clostridium botulinum TaxID=1491 RepID=UPI000D0CA138|nr:hypothetical protein [Clostridium botulinum]PSL96307.1 hypothetical protein C6C12_19325 [Clostridium botulinum]HDK7138409.1 hypothetical protein [Clostridium botulinum]HDK7141738.1 hypothetical protein [Clostridium botulinum]HDK7146447.1 hypothetical protein [Clostridium botulinum]HDK7150151.1 hypothetical protein [Clostridium botulinum]
MKIKHPKVNEYYNYLKDSFANVNLSEEHRMYIYKRIEIIEALVDLYEQKYEFDDETIEDLKLKYRPVFPKKLKNIQKNLEKTIIK